MSKSKAGPPTTETVLEDVVRRRGGVRDEQRFVAERDPAFLAAYEALYEASLNSEDGASIRIREFVAIAVLLTRGASDAGIERHMRRALDHGATIDELFGVVQAMVLPGGGPVYSRGLGILRRVAGSADGT